MLALAPTMVLRNGAWCGVFALMAACDKGASPADPFASYPRPSVAKDGEVVARIGPVTLTTVEIENRIQQQTPFMRAQLQDPKELAKWVENEVRMELLAQEGWRRNLPNDPRIQAELKRLVIQRIMTDQMERLKDKADVNELDLQNAWKAREAEFNKPERVRVAQIVRYVENESERKAAKKLLEQVKAEVLAAQKKNDSGAFSVAAEKHSQDDATNKGGGDLQFLTRDELTERYGKEVSDFLFDQVQIGDMAVADASNAAVLFKKTGFRRGVTRTLEQVKPQIRSQLLGEKKTQAFVDFVKQLQTERGVVFDTERLAKIRVSEPRSADAQ